MRSLNLKTHNWPTIKRVAAIASRRLGLIALSAGTLFTGIAPAAFAQYNPPADLGLPSRREPGGTRGGCPTDFTFEPTTVPVDARSLTPLIPQDNHFGQTLSPYPTFYWYVPAIQAQAAEFVLMDELNNEIYTVKFQIESTEGGVVSLTLPENAGMPPLEVNQNYHWYFSLICDEFDRGTDIFTDGWVRRVESDLLPSLADLPDGSVPAQANDYAQAGIWYEAFEILAEDRRMQDGISSPEWERLLESVGLGEYTDVSFLQY